MLRYLPFLLVLGLWIYAFIDCLNTPEQEVRKLPKAVWVLIVVLFGYVLFGSLAWLIAGRPRRRAGGGAGRALGGGRTRWVAPDDNPEFLKSLDEQKKRDGADGERRPQEPPEKPGPEAEREEDRGRGRDTGPEDPRT